jgi:hypothetical protein
MKHAKYPLLLPLLAAVSFNACACYTVYDRSNRVVYLGESPPVDMSRQLHETLPARYPAGQLVFDGATRCPEIDRAAPVVTLRDTAPLLTQKRIAQAMKVPYTVLSGDIVLVPPGHVQTRPAVTIIPPQALDDSSLGRDTVITELHDPPMTIVQSANGTVIGNLAR